MNFTDRSGGDDRGDSRTRTVLRGLRAIYGGVVIYFGLLIFGLGCLIWSGVAVLLGLVLSKDRGKVVGRWVTCYGFRLYLWALVQTGAFRFDLEALDALRDAGSLIIAPNHPCLLDAVMILSRLPASCVMKADLIDNPIYGASARLADYIRNDDSIGAVTQAVETLKKGNQLLLFPEGTRTTQPPVNHLKGGALLVSKRSGVPIQTVIIETTSPFLSKGWPLHRIPRLPISYRVRLGRRFMPRENLAQAISELETYLVSELGRSGGTDGAEKVTVPPANPRLTGR